MSTRFKKFRKRQVIIDAILWDNKKETLETIRKFEEFEGAFVHDSDKKTLMIPTLEGDMIASCGDMIIRGISGELYPCKPSIFAMTYDVA